MIIDMNWHEKTIDTYDKSAEKLAEYFKGIGPRIEDIERALELAGCPPDARLVEIGCGDGRDAIEITKRVGWYEGFDPSKSLLSIAARKVSKANFIEADALTYEYPKDIDVVFAFASLLHVSRDNLPAVFYKIAQSLRPGGIAYLSLKEREYYVEETKIDEYGERMFYYYTPEIIKELAGNAFKSVFEDHQTIGKTRWFTLALQKAG
jgi:SAM-dependent methyltransferase